MTFFAPDMVERIERLKEDGVLFATELMSESGLVNNATLLGPDGESLFLFEGEI
jgi:hypothetical protein